MLYWISYVAGIAEEGEDSFSAMRRAKKNISLKGKGTRIVEVSKEVLEYCLEKVIIKDNYLNTFAN